MEQLWNEISIIQKLDHPYILKMFEYFEDDKNIYLVTEICTGGDLFDKIVDKDGFKEKEAAKVFKQILLGINYCHTNNVVHRDLKPENILYDTDNDDSDIKIIDFGISKIFKKGKMNRMKSRKGTPSYVSPGII